MYNNNSGFPRRRFLKGLTVLAAIPIIPKFSFAVDGSLAKSSSHKILTCNIRVALVEDDEAGFGWESRKKLCAEVMRRQKPDIICMQEVLREQNEDLKRAFPEFFSFGFDGPEMDKARDGYAGIAKNPIFFSTKRYELISAGGYWLSETPLIAGSLSWGTARARNANWVRLKDKKSGKDFRIVNLHLDHQSQPAREKQIQVVLEEASQYPGDFTQILTGDFNAGAQNRVYEMVRKAGWTDTYTVVNGEKEPGFTAHGFKPEKKQNGSKIDFIFTQGPSLTVLDAKVLKDNDRGRYPSDHYFVSAEVGLD